ncbi:MAG: TldD/PmbA family protein [Acidobacteriota bacterium]
MKILFEILEPLSKTFNAVEILYKDSRTSLVQFNRTGIIQTSDTLEYGTAIRVWNEKGDERFHHFSGCRKNIPELIEQLQQGWKKSDGDDREDLSMLPANTVSCNRSGIYCRRTASLSHEEREAFINKLIDLFEERKKSMQLDHCQLLTSFSSITLLNSKGFHGTYERTTACTALTVRLNPEESPVFDNKAVVGNKSVIEEKINGLSNVSFDYASCSFYDLNIDTILKEIVSFPCDGRVISNKQASSVSTGCDEVMFFPQAGAELLKLIIPYLIGSSKNYRRDSVGSVNKRCLNKGSAILFNNDSLSDKLSIVDDPAMPRGLSSVPFDGVGFPVEKTAVIDEGNIVNCLKSMVRASYMDRPTLGPTNLYIKPGKSKPEEMLKGIGKGLYLFSITPFSSLETEGEVLFSGSGFLVEDGRIVSPYRNFFLRGKLMNLFKNILEVGTDLRFSFRGGSIGSPSLLIKGLDCCEAQQMHDADDWREKGGRMV